ncbi:rCG26420 [Rattus norvegicus]|uniref:RCG26420 n=1 Tax=Rattus norvegicus TaxID=10116 RepID=A6HM53_RAT|nr:rCG26420 [Rattus norvegicus]
MGLGNSFWFSGFVLLWFWSGFVFSYSSLVLFFPFFFLFCFFLFCHSPSQKPPSTLLI